MFGKIIETKVKRIWVMSKKFRRKYFQILAGNTEKNITFAIKILNLRLWVFSSTRAT